MVRRLYVGAQPRYRCHASGGGGTRVLPRCGAVCMLLAVVLVTQPPQLVSAHAAAAAQTDYTAQGCGVALSCLTCVGEAAGCGWCADSGSGGAAGAASQATAIVPVAATARPTSEHTGTNGQCLASSTGGGNCRPPATWSTSDEQCRDVACARLLDCDSCVTAASGACGACRSRVVRLRSLVTWYTRGCRPPGWCSTTGQCEYGSQAGPVDGAHQCPATDDDSSPWRWRTCADTCSAEQSCVACTHHTTSCGAMLRTVACSFARASRRSLVA